MNILCVCDLAITPKVMQPMKKLEKLGHTVTFFVDETMQTPKAITEVMLKTEQGGADACPANPKLAEQVQNVDIIVVHASPVNTEVLEKAENLKYVAVLRSGTENVQQALCQQRGIQIINAPGRSAPAVADFAVGLMIAENKNIARGHMALMNGKWTKQFTNFDYVHDMRKCTVGIIGAGQIGQKVIERLQGFAPKIVVHDPFVSDEQIQQLGYEPVSLPSLLQQSDFVSIHLRLSEKTERFMGENEFAQMKKTAYFINTARAGLVDEAALLDALKTKSIGGAASDVFAEEPLPANSPWLSLDNVTLTPHVAGTSVDSFENSVEIIFNELNAL